MLIKGEIKGVKVVKKLDDNRKEIVIVDLRVQVLGGDVDANPLLEMTGSPVKLSIEAAQLKIT